jgi:acyl carrier protein/NADP-dependent 3-hydroxy acid dehydrogenase YdfG
MIEHGAGHLVLVSRRAASEGARQSIAELEVMGATVSVRSADVSLDADVGSLLDEIGRKMPPLRGIVHAAGILDDAVISGLTLEKFESVMAGKVSGALALNARMASLDLDFLVYFSSVAGLIGTPGQANYAAANAMLDSLAHQQRARGIPAISINWGTWKDVGLAAAEDNRGARMAGQGLSPLTPSTGAALLMRILGHAPAQVAAMHFEADQWCASHPAAARSLVFADLISHSGRKAVGLEDLPEDMGALDGEALMEWLRKQVAAVLRMNPDRVPEDKPLRSLGLDSLMALELRNRMERSLRLKLSATLVWNYPTIATMAEHLRTRLAAAPSGTPAAGEKSTSSNGTKPLTQAQGEGSSISAAEMLEMELLGAESLLRN